MCAAICATHSDAAERWPYEGEAPTPPANPRGPYELRWTTPYGQGHNFGGDVIFSGDGKRLLAARDSEAYVWDTATWKAVGSRIEYGDWLYDVSFDAAGKRVLVVRNVMHAERIEYLDAQWRVWDVETGKAVGPAVRHEKKKDQKNFTAKSARMSPDGQWVAVAAGRTAEVWHVDKGEKKHSFELEYKDYVDLFSADSKSLIVSDYHGHAQFWHLESGRFGEGRDTPIGGTWHLAGGRRLIDTGFGFRVLDVRIGKNVLVKDDQYDKYEILDMHISAGGNRVAVESGQKNQTQVWDVETGKIIGTIPSADVMAFDPAGTTLLALDADGAALFSVETGKRVRDLGEEFIQSATFSPDGNLLAITEIVGNGYVVRVIRADPAKKGTERWVELK